MYLATKQEVDLKEYVNIKETINNQLKEKKNNKILDKIIFVMCIIIMIICLIVGVIL